MKKIALVTGSRRGIGRGIAEALGRAGYFVVLSATAASDDALVADLTAQGIDCTYIPCDISDDAAREHIFSEIMSRYGRLDVLVNNAGVAPTVRADVLETAPESFDRVLRVNLRGCFYMCQKAANLMIEGKKTLEDYQPRIVNIGSISAYTSSTNRAEYCISKAGVGMVTALFADRLATEGIPVFEVRPGIIKTDMTAGVQEKYNRMIDAGVTPIRRMGEPADVAGCVMAAVSGMLDFATGQVLNADGGFHLRRL